MLYLALLFALLLAGCGAKDTAQPVSSGYIDSRACAGCHAQIALSYAQTGMARAFHPIRPDEVPTAKFTHEKSGRSYQFLTRDGKVFLKRTTLDGGFPIEKEIHYVLGSGNHARSFLHRTPQGRLIEMPVNWYSERNGFLAMSPGYDRPDHLDMRRAIGYQCAFCHNAYPGIPKASLLDDPIFPAKLPEGIDCQRCHGPGREHASSGGRGKILNPKKLSGTRKMEVCLQCHLESTSFPLPFSIVRHDQPVFSYNPAQPLESYILHFDHARGTPRDDKFEIAGSAYRLRQSKCFRLSEDRLTCTTCHNPHERTRAAAVDAACRGCHPSIDSQARHPASADCASCHMPKRRTEDVVHVALTDHKIQRPNAKLDPLAPLSERHETIGKDSYRGEVVPYYPAQPENDLYPALAQVLNQANIEKGIPRLAAALKQHQPAHPAFAVHMAQALHSNAKPRESLPYYHQALALDPAYLPALRNLGATQFRLNDLTAARATLEKAVSLHPNDSLSWLELARLHHAQRQLSEALAAARKAIAAEPELIEAYKTLAAILSDSGDRSAAEQTLLAALREQPDEPELLTSLANLEANNNSASAELHYLAALRLSPGLKAAHFNLALLYANLKRFPEAVSHSEAALEPNRIDSLLLLAQLNMALRDFRAAAAAYRRALAIQPTHGPSLIGLATALGATGDFRSARAILTQAAASPDSKLRSEANQLLSTLP